MKYHICTLLLLTTSAFGQSSTAFGLPFGIKISQTKAEELENRGVCRGKIQVRESYFRCEAYLMKAGFIVTMSQNELVTSLRFTDKFPKKWRSIGVKSAMLHNDFLSVLKRQSIQNAELINTHVHNHNGAVYGSNIEFELGDYSYVASFYVDTDKEDLKYGLDNLELRSIEVTESF